MVFESVNKLSARFVSNLLVCLVSEDVEDKDVSSLFWIASTVTLLNVCIIFSWHGPNWDTWIHIEINDYSSMKQFSSFENFYVPLQSILE